jgi:hypothetical protein
MPKESGMASGIEIEVQRTRFHERLVGQKFPGGRKNMVEIRVLLFL